MTIAVDFDGTIVENRYPNIGNEMPFATQTLKMLQGEGHQIILWTVRNGKLLNEALEWCRRRGLEFYAVNRNFDTEEYDSAGPFSVKVKADMFIDDRNVGGMLDWGTIYMLIHENLTIEEAGRRSFIVPNQLVTRWGCPYSQNFSPPDKPAPFPEQASLRHALWAG